MHRFVSNWLCAALACLANCAYPETATVSSDASTVDAPAAAAERVVRLISRHSGLALDVWGISRDNGAPIQQWTYWASPNQRWRLVQHGDSYDLVSVHSNLCLDVAGASKDIGAPVIQWACSGAANQRWQFVPTDAGAYKLKSVNSGMLLDVSQVSKQPGARLHQWSDWGGQNQHWFVEVVDDKGQPTGETGPGASDSPPKDPEGPTEPPSPGTFGNRLMHPEKIGFYMVPDLEDPYRVEGGPSGERWCRWGRTQASLMKLRELLPNAVVRWDNETGHHTDSPENVETMVSCFDRAGVNMIITATAIDGYNNWWANGNRTPNASLIDFANSPYVAFAAQLWRRYPVVQLVETANEPDGPWFNSDGDNVGNFDYYMNRLVDAMGGDRAHILGPSAAFTFSNIWNYYIRRNELPNVSFHTYSGASALFDLSGKNIYVTEYGGFDLNPGAILADLWQAERHGKLDSTIKVLNYVQITDNGGNRGAFNSRQTEGNHFALRDWFRALTLYQAVATTAGQRGYFDDANPDYVAADSGKGDFAALVWNAGGGSLSGERRLSGTSLPAQKPLYVVHVGVGDAQVARCAPVAQQNWLRADVSGNSVTLQIRNLEAKAAVWIGTRPCDYLAN